MATATLNVTNSQSITATLTSLSNGSSVTSSAIDNSTNKFMSALVRVQVRTAAASTSATGSVNVFLVRSVDGGSNYDDGLFLGSIPTVANSTTYVRTFSTESLGPLGSHWKIIVTNNSAATLDASVGAASFAGVKYDIA